MKQIEGLRRNSIMPMMKQWALGVNRQNSMQDEESDIELENPRI